MIVVPWEVGGVAGGRKRIVVKGFRALVFHPGLWPVACGQCLRFVRPGWWRSFPFLPVPDGKALYFRLETAYGSSLDQMSPKDVRTYLIWCRLSASADRHLHSS